MHKAKKNAARLHEEELALAGKDAFQKIDVLIGKAKVVLLKFDGQLVPLLLHDGDEEEGFVVVFGLLHGLEECAVPFVEVVGEDKLEEDFFGALFQEHLIEANLLAIRTPKNRLLRNLDELEEFIV